MAEAQLSWRHRARHGTHVLEGDTVIGRADDCHFRLPWPAPKRAAVIGRNGRAYEVRGLSRWIALRVNGTPTTQARLKSGDRVTVGRLELLFLDRVD